MFGGAGVQVPANWLKRMPWIEVVGIEGRSEWLVFSGAEQVFALVALFMIVLLLPNPLQIMREVMVPPNANAMPESKATRLLWKPTRTWALVSGVIFTIALLHLGKLSEFLYFQF
jgi:hypothetical protein